MKAAKFAGSKAFIIKQRENGIPVAEICDQSAQTALPCIARLDSRNLRDPASSACGRGRVKTCTEEKMVESFFLPGARWNSSGSLMGSHQAICNEEIKYIPAMV
jgi:hypothetical protein